ncbi:hypothetical protein F444_09488 [Phytophthora nicotianae P1976]|uniref:Uncharacterized protein n=1 Tax=Phytophthora nicotianae P1976 TaxID=1317066 RepID=A0A081A7J8_PHYNI|nr:hypothetical protein F444_09488 [Phytophthora nicotianae P1976]
MTSVHLAISKLPWSYELTNFPKTSNHIKFTTQSSTNYSSTSDYNGPQGRPHLN